MLDCTGSFSDAAKVGDPHYQAPEILRAYPDVKIPYTPSGESYSSTLLFFNLVTFHPMTAGLLSQMNRHAGHGDKHACADTVWLCQATCGAWACCYLCC